MKITCNIQNNVISINYAGLGISIDRNQILDSADQLIALFHILPFPADAKADVIKDLDQIKQYLPIFRKFSDSLVYKNDCSAEITINEDGTIDISQTEYQSMINLPKIVSAICDFNELKNRLSEERQARYEAREREWEAEMKADQDKIDAELAAMRTSRLKKRTLRSVNPTAEQLAYICDVTTDQVIEAAYKIDLMILADQKLDDESVVFIGKELGINIQIDYSARHRHESMKKSNKTFVKDKSTINAEELQSKIKSVNLNGTDIHEEETE